MMAPLTVFHFLLVLFSLRIKGNSAKRILRHSHSGIPTLKASESLARMRMRCAESDDNLGDNLGLLLMQM